MGFNHKILNDYPIKPIKNGFYMVYNGHRKTYILFDKEYKKENIFLNCGKKLAGFICNITKLDLKTVNAGRWGYGYEAFLKDCKTILLYDSMNKQYMLLLKYGTYESLKGYKNIKKFLSLYGVDFDKSINDYWKNK